MGRSAAATTKRMGAAALALGLAALLPLAGCQGAPQGNAPEAPAGQGQSATEVGGVAGGPTAGGNAVGVGSSACFAALTPESAWAQADVICSATYIDRSEPFLVEGAGTPLSPLYYADYRFEVDEVFSGELPRSARESGVVTVREEVGGVASNADRRDASIERRGLLVLAGECRRDGFSTEGDHLYFVTQWNWWPEVEPGTFRSGAAGSVTVEELRAMDPALAGSQNRATQDAAYLAEIEERYRNGEYSKSYYEQLRAQAGAKRYGHVMTPEERRAYEEHGPESGVGMTASA